MAESYALPRDRMRPAPELYLLGVGLVVCLGVALRNPVISLDQFFHPKELALTVFGFAAAVVCAGRARWLAISAIDGSLMGFLAWSAVATLGAANPWWAWHALGMSAAGLAVFWTARWTRDEGRGPALVGFIALAVAMVATVAVLQAYGFVLHVSPGNKAPGGTLGNRNAMAHLLTVGLPTFALAALSARRRWQVLATTAAVAVIAAAMVLSRSRAAWLATMVLSGTTAIGIAIGWHVCRRAFPVRRAGLLTAAALAGIAGALYLPNKLVWTSPTPYRDSLLGLGNYESGSGRGRILQDVNTLAMIRDRPLVGVGPGNWPVRYPEYAPPDDPTFNTTDPVPVRRFPNGDWLGLAAERGVPALILLLLAGALLARGAWRTLRESADPASVGHALALAGTLTTLAVLGLLDPVLLPPGGTYLALMVLGTLAPREPRYLLARLAPSGRRAGVALLLAVGLGFVVLSARQVWGVLLYRAGREPTQLARAARTNPGDYLAHVLLAQRWVELDRCDLAAAPIARARALYPAAPLPARLGNACSLREPPPSGWSSALETLSTKVVFSPRCRRVIYSSNRDDRIAPFMIDFESPTPSSAPIDVPPGHDLFVRSLSPGCRFLALVADGDGDGTFKVYVFDLATHRLVPLGPDSRANEGEPKFAPQASLLAYLADGRLQLYDPDSARGVATPASPAEFTSIEWSPDAESIFLEDRGTNIWEYRVPERAFKRIWKAPARAYSPRMIQAWDHYIYFVSDHESPFTQIYELDLVSSSLRRVLPSSHPQYSPRRVSSRELLFRTNVDGNVVAMRLRDGRLEQMSPSQGVVYDMSLDFGRPLFVYAGERQITSIYAADPATGALEDLLDHGFQVAQPRPREFRTAEGMVHVVFAADSHPRGWVVWLHGGPHEQVSPRFNPYFDFLTRLGFGVVALNYPGSTGIGKAYELRDVPDSTLVARQLAGIDTALGEVATLYPDFHRYALVGVSYGSALAFLHACEHPAAVTQIVDFSGAATAGTRAALPAACPALPPTLAIQGVNDPAQRSPERRAFVRVRDRTASTRQVLLDGEGHYVGRLGSMRIVLGEMERFFTGGAS